MTTFRICLVASTFIVLVDVAASPAQTLRGTFVDRETRAPIPGARLLLRTLNAIPIAQATTDTAGQFVLRASTAGHFRLQVEHAAFEETNVPIILRDGFEIQFELEADARKPEPTLASQNVATRPASVVPLEPIRVMAARSPELARRGTSINLITRAQIAQRRGSARHVGDLVRSLPGLQVHEGSVGGVAQGLCIESERRYLRGRPSQHTRPDSCEMVKVYVDDYPVFDPGAYLTTIRPADLESVEFLSPVEAAARFGRDAARGVLVIYTVGSGPHVRKEERTSSSNEEASISIHENALLNSGLSEVDQL